MSDARSRPNAEATRLAGPVRSAGVDDLDVSLSNWGVGHTQQYIDFAVAVFVVDQGRVLLGFHRRLQRWLPLGGHIEPGEDPEQAALREVREESGLDVELWGERPPVSGHGTRALIAPRFLDIHAITDTHQHVGMIYWARPRGRRLAVCSSEHQQLRWCCAVDLDRLQPPLLPSIRWYARTALAELSSDPALPDPGQ